MSSLTAFLCRIFLSVSIVVVPALATSLSAEEALVFISKIKKDSVAEKVGLKIGDGIIKIEGASIKTPDQAGAILKKYFAQVKIEIIRKGSRKMVFLSKQHSWDPYGVSFTDFYAVKRIKPEFIPFETTRARGYIICGGMMKTAVGTIVSLNIFLENISDAPLYISTGQFYCIDGGKQLLEPAPDQLVADAYAATIETPDLPEPSGPSVGEFLAGLLTVTGITGAIAVQVSDGNAEAAGFAMARAANIYLKSSERYMEERRGFYRSLMARLEETTLAKRQQVWEEVKSYWNLRTLKSTNIPPGINVDRYLTYYSPSMRPPYELRANIDGKNLKFSFTVEDVPEPISGPTH